MDPIGTTARRRTEDERAEATPPAAAPKKTELPVTRWILSQGTTRGAVDYAREVVRAQSVPLHLQDLSLYTDDALERELDIARRQPAGAPFLDRIEQELARRKAPPMQHAGMLKTVAEAEAAVAGERAYLARYGGKLANDVRARREGHLSQLVARRDVLALGEKACDGASPTMVGKLPGGATRVDVTADQIVDTLKKSTPLTPTQEAQVRATFESWRQGVCLREGRDPTHFADGAKYREAKVDETAHRAATAQKYWEMIQAIAGSAMGAAAFLDSVARHDSIDAAHARVMGATHLAAAGGTVVHAQPIRMAAPSTKAEAREIDGLAQRMHDEVMRNGHAMDSRFHGTDTSAFAKSPSEVRYGPYRPNRPGQTRTLADLPAIYKKATGRDLPPWVRLESGKLHKSKYAEYTIRPQGKPNDKLDADDFHEGVTVRIREDVLASDEAIVDVLRHEMWELETFAATLEHGKTLTAGQLYRRAQPHPGEQVEKRVNGRLEPELRENVHGQAWNISNMETFLTRITDPYDRQTQINRINNVSRQYNAQNGLPADYTDNLRPNEMTKAAYDAETAVREAAKKAKTGKGE